MLPMQTAPRPAADTEPPLTDAVQEIILQRMALRESPWRIAAYLQATFRIEIDADRIFAFWNARSARATTAAPTRTGPGQEKESMHVVTEAADDATERRPDKESMQLPADEPGEPLLTLVPRAETPDPASVSAVTVTETAPLTPIAPARCEPTPTEPTRTGPGPETESEADEVVPIPDEVREFIIERMARGEPPFLIAGDVERKFGFLVDREEILVCWRDRDMHPTRTGPGPEKKSRPKLSDEVKEFIVKRLACYQTPSQIAAAVRIDFGIDIDRRRVFDYDPAGSRPPAQRWIDLHAATRARFNRAEAEIAIAQKVVRLRMLDRMAHLAEERDQPDRAAKFLVLAARECGGFYERRRVPTLVAQQSGS